MRNSAGGVSGVIRTALRAAGTSRTREGALGCGPMDERLYDVFRPAAHLFKAAREPRDVLRQIIDARAHLIDAPVYVIKALVHPAVGCADRNEHGDRASHYRPELGAHGRTIP